MKVREGGKPQEHNALKKKETAKQDCSAGRRSVKSEGKGGSKTGTLLSRGR